MINILFSPSIKLLSRFSFLKKMILIGLVFTAPVVYMLYQLNNISNANIDFARAEVTGTAQLTIALKALNSAQQHRWNHQKLLMDSSSDATSLLNASQAELDEALSDLEKTNPALAAIEQSNVVVRKSADVLSGLKKTWDSLKNASATLTAEQSLEQHNTLIDQIIDYIVLIGDNSNLTLDPDLDSYYIMDIVVSRLPSLLEQLHRSTQENLLVLKKQAQDQSQQIKLAIINQNLSASIDAVNSDLTKIFSVNDDLKKKYKDVFEKNLADVSAINNNNIKRTLTNDFSMEIKPYVESFLNTNGALYSTLRNSNEELSNLLAIRIAKNIASRNNIFALCFILFLIVIYLYVGFIKSVSSALFLLKEGARRIANGNLKEPVPITTSDEIADVAYSINDAMGTLSNFVTEQQHVASQHNEHGQISASMPEDEFQGTYRDMAINMNDMIASLIDLEMRFAALMKNYASGEFSEQLEEQIGEKKSISDAATLVRNKLLTAYQEAQSNARIKMALDSVSIPVRITDAECNIIYINHALRNILFKYEDEFKKISPSFQPEKVIGSSIKILYNNQENAVKKLKEVTDILKERLQLGGRTYDVVTTVVKSDHGDSLGTIGQWSDITNQLGAEREISEIVEAAINGDFSKRVETQGKEEFFVQLANGMNTIFETNEIGLNEIARVLDALTHGDLTQKIDKQFSGMFAKLQTDVNTTVDQLKKMIEQIRHSSISINSSATEIAAGNSDLAERTKEQASGIETTAQNMKLLTAALQQNTDDAVQANTRSADASKVASRGGQVVSEVVTLMDSITESSRKIVDVINLIDDIAFQTNILALNASVEAARAGEQGMGFAAVASEVRNLAQRSATAAKEIEALISESVEHIKLGSERAHIAGNTINDVVDTVSNVTSLMDRISTSSSSQSSNLKQVNQMMSQMDTTTQHNAALVQQAAANASSLKSASDQLLQLVATFKV